MGVLVELKPKKALVVGGGQVALRRILKLKNTCYVKVVSKKVSDKIKKLGVEFEEREFKEGDTEGFDIVFAATSQPDVNEKIYRDAKKHGAMVNVADRSDLCDFFMLATVESGRFKIAVSSGGKAPAFSSALRRYLERSLPIDKLEDALAYAEKVRGLRVAEELTDWLVKSALGERRRKVFVIGTNHKMAPVEVREEIARKLKVKSTEKVVVSTCGRFEIYSVSNQQTLSTIIKQNKLPQIYFKTDAEAFKHLALVIAGCNSQILGEGQIKGQVKEAYETARSKGKTGKILNRMFQMAFRTAKKIRREAGIKTSLSLPKLAVEEVKKRKSLEDVVVIGTGEAAELVLKALRQEGVRTKIWGRGRVDELALKYRALKTDTPSGKVAFVATNSPVPKISAEIIFDLSVPRVVKGENVIHIDDLKIPWSEEAIEQAERIAEEEAEKFAKWLDSLFMDEIIKSFIAKYDAKKLRAPLRKIKQRPELALALAEIFLL